MIDNAQLLPYVIHTYPERPDKLIRKVEKVSKLSKTPKNKNNLEEHVGSPNMNFYA
jgi:hypothetical protein